MTTNLFLFATRLLLVAALWFPFAPKVAGGNIQDVKHVVILMHENRSFDHYFGMLQGVRGYNDPSIGLFQNGSSYLFQPNGSANSTVPFELSSKCNYHWLGYQTRSNLSFYYGLADAYTICDANFCSFPGSTFPNRIYLFSGMIDPGRTGNGPSLDNNVPTNGYSWTTYPERLQTAGVSWRVYHQPLDWYGDALQWFAQYRNAAPGNPLYDRGVATVNDVVAAFKADVTNGTLPQVSWIVPPDGTYSEHAPWSVQKGQWFAREIVSTLAANPAVFNSTVFIFNYDEEGGYFDHVRPPTAPPGTPGEFYNGRPVGLGSRVPLIICSPWTRGGKVCSQVFDHTSILRFLELWTGVQEPNISAWRRQTCGDLTSAFDFANPDFSVPQLPPTPWGSCEGHLENPPAIQSLPLQESGVRPACPLPYQPDASCRTDCGSNRVSILMTNAGSAAVHFAIYANAYRTDGPWQFDAPSGQSATASFVSPPAAQGRYDFTCRGPNGFQRRFAGNITKDCNQIEVTSQIDPVAGSITVGLANSSAAPVIFTITNAYLPDQPAFFELPPASFTNQMFAAQADNHGWYDLMITADADTNFVRRLDGHIENGLFSVTEAPAIIGNAIGLLTNPPPAIIVPPVTNPPPVLPPALTIYDVVHMVALHSAVLFLNSNPPVLSIGTLDTNCVLLHPTWASNYFLEQSLSLNPPIWMPLNATSTVISNFNVFILPATNSREFFRLRQ